MPSPEAALLSPRLRQQELVASFGLFAMQAENLQVILSEASAAAARGMDVRFGKVLEHLPSENSFLVRAGIGWRPGVVGQARLRGDLESPAGYAFRTAQPVVCNALNAEERFRTPHLLAEHGVMSAINVIISAGNAPPFGVLEADSTHRGDFGGHDVAFLQSLANTLAVAIEMQKRQDARMELLRDKEALLREKDLLMQEIHHRVKNSLQLVRTLLSLQARGLSNPEAREKLTDAAGRILTISAVHQRLYGGGSLGRIDAVQYLRGLLDDMQAMRAGTAPIALSAEPFELAADDMTSLGLIVTELVTNALKYGSGQVRVALRQLDGEIEIAVSDDGSGFPPGFDPATGNSLGMRLITALSRIPDGAVRIDRSGATSRVVVRMAVAGGG